MFKVIPSIIKRYLPAVVILLIGQIMNGQNFELAPVNVSDLKEQLASASNKEVIYHYLSNNYKPTSEKYDLKYFEGDTDAPCAFKEEFENDIKYTMRQCDEGGIRTFLELPKVARKNLMKWVEDIYEVNKMDMDQNVWKENNSKFEPKESDPGCYFKIEEQENSSLINLYCGC